jgi:hypothetical protein
MLLHDSNVSDAIYRAMWFISRRAGVKLIQKSGLSTGHFEIVK